MTEKLGVAVPSPKRQKLSSEVPRKSDEVTIKTLFHGSFLTGEPVPNYQNVCDQAFFNSLKSRMHAKLNYVRNWSTTSSVIRSWGCVTKSAASPWRNLRIYPQSLLWVVRVCNITAAGTHRLDGDYHLEEYTVTFSHFQKLESIRIHGTGLPDPPDLSVKLSSWLHQQWKREWWSPGRHLWN